MHASDSFELVDLPSRPRGEVVEHSVGVGLGPHTDATGTTERAVVRVDPLRAVPVHLDMVSLELDPQLVPDARCDLPAPIGELDPASVLHVVEADVVLERVGARQIVVVLILVSEHETARPVNIPRHRLALHGDAAVSEGWRRGSRNGEPVISAVAGVLAQVDSDRAGYRLPVAAAPSPTLPEGSLTRTGTPVVGSGERACRTL